MTSAFLPSHHTVPVTPGTGAATSESQQEMVGTTHMEARVEMPDTVKHSKQKPIRVLVVDDHEIVRKGLCTMLGEQDDFEVVGQASSGNLAVTLAMQLQPDIVLLDIFLGAFNGLDIAQQLHRACPKTRVVILTGLSDLEIELVRLAAAGCSNKEIASRQFWSEVTVKRKMQDIYRKLQVTDRAQAVAEAMRMGLI